MPLRFAQISSCSTAAARKVSAAHNKTDMPSFRKRFASFPMLVVLPAPFTPTMKITRGPDPFVVAARAAGEVPSVPPDGARIRTMCDLISRFSWPASQSALRSSFSRTASRISRVGLTPRSAASSAVSSCFSSAGSILRSPRKIVSTVSESAALVLLTETFNRSRSVGSGSFLPKREIIQESALIVAQHKIVSEEAQWAGQYAGTEESQQLDVHFNRAEAEFAGVDDGLQRRHHDGVEFRTGVCLDPLQREFQIHRRLVRPVGGHSIERIGHADDPRHQRNLRALQAVRITAPFTVCCFIKSYSSGVSAPGFFSTRSSTPILPTSCSSAAIFSLSRSSLVSPSSRPISVENLATRPE